MNCSELKERLLREGVREDVYSLMGDSLLFDGFVLSQQGGEWVVYYRDERGSRSHVRAFATQEEACQDLLDRLLADPNTRRENLSRNADSSSRS